MQHLPLVSLIIPSFNQGAFLEATLCSALEQDYPRLELLVIDGGSSDESPSILQRYSDRLAYWVSEPDRGQAHAINKGLQAARGSLLGWLNSDDLLLPGTVARAVQVFQERPEVDVVYGRLERIDADGRLIPTPRLPKDVLEFSIEHVLGECIVNQPGSFWRRAVMEKAGLLDERLHYALDYEYWIRLALLGARFARLPQPVARFRLSPASKTVSQAAAMAQEQVQVVRETLERYNLKALCDWDPPEAAARARKTVASASLLAFNAELKRRRLRPALSWLWQALRSDPGVLFQRRWLDLAWASLQRRRRRWTIIHPKS